MSHFYPENYNFQKKNPSWRVKEYDFFLSSPRNVLLYTLIQIITFIFLNFEILLPVQGSENIENALKYEIFQMMVES